MALVKSKQIKDLAAIKVVETTEKRFVSDVEKAVFNDKYTKLEADTSLTEAKTALTEQITTVDNSLTEAKNDLTGKITTVNDTLTADKAELNQKITTVDETLTAAKTDLTEKITSVNSNLSSEIQTLNTDLTGKITAAIQGITWKSPVPTFNDIATVYPTPAEGWFVTVEDTNKVFRYDEPTTTWVEFPLQVPQTYVKTINIMVTQNGQKTLNTGIRNDNTGAYKTGHADVAVTVNGFAQSSGLGKDYVSEFIGNEVVITWLDRHFALEEDDDVQVTYTHFELV